MKQLTRAQYFFLGSMLFGMMFGAGNLIFPVHLGQLAGSHFWLANWGFISTGVFMPFIGLIALGISGATSVEDLANRIHPTFPRSLPCCSISPLVHVLRFLERLLYPSRSGWLLLCLPVQKP